MKNVLASYEAQNLNDNDSNNDSDFDEGSIDSEPSQNASESSGQIINNQSIHHNNDEPHAANDSQSETQIVCTCFGLDDDDENLTECDNNHNKNSDNNKTVHHNETVQSNDTIHLNTNEVSTGRKSTAGT